MFSKKKPEPPIEGAYVKLKGGEAQYPAWSISSKSRISAMNNVIPLFYSVIPCHLVDSTLRMCGVAGLGVLFP